MTMRASLTARIVRRSLGWKWETRPAPPVSVWPSVEISTSPLATSRYVRSCTWCSWSCSPAGRWMAIARVSSSERSTLGWWGSIASEPMSQVFVAHVPDRSCRPTHDHLAGPHIAGDQRPGSDERLLSDLHAGHEHGAAAHAARAAKNGSLKWLAGGVAAHCVVVRRRDARPEEHVVLDDRASRDIDPGLDQYAIADDGSEVNRRAAPDDGPGADRRAFAHLGLVADDRAGPDP